MECCNCGAPAEHRHHIVPRSMGGSDKPSNLAPVCASCHGLIHDSRMVRLSRLAKEGQQRAKTKGVPFGPKRKYTDAQAEHVQELRSQGKSYGAISAATGMTVSTVRRILGVA